LNRRATCGVELSDAEGLGVVAPGDERLDRLIAPVGSLPFAVFQRSARIFLIARSTPFNWNNCGSDRIALVDVAPGDIGFLLTRQA
jgi:hypothetical protein